MGRREKETEVEKTDNQLNLLHKSPKYSEIEGIRYLRNRAEVAIIKNTGGKSIKEAFRSPPHRHLAFPLGRRLGLFSGASEQEVNRLKDNN